MAKVPKLKLKIDFEEIFGAKINDAALRQAIGGAIIDRITERTQDGTSLRGNAFKGYSKAYKESLAFKVAGKTSLVNMTLSGDMLSSMEVLEESPGALTIGFANETDNAKAYNHNVGDTLPKREFFGITQKEKQSLKSEFQELISEINTLRESKTKDEFLTRATKTIATLMQDQEEE